MDLQGFELREGYACFRPWGPITPEAYPELLKKAMLACQEHQVTRLLVDVRLLTHRPITDIDRFHIADTLAAFWDRRIKLATVGRTDQIGPERFGILVAKNRGLYAWDCTSESEALNLLLGRSPGV